MTALAVLAWGLLCLHWLGLVLRQAKQLPEVPDHYDCFVLAFFALIFLAGSAFLVACNVAGAIAFDLATR